MCSHLGWHSIIGRHTFLGLTYPLPRHCWRRRRLLSQISCNIFTKVEFRWNMLVSWRVSQMIFVGCRWLPVSMSWKKPPHLAPVGGVLVEHWELLNLWIEDNRWAVCFFTICRVLLIKLFQNRTLSRVRTRLHWPYCCIYAFSVNVLHNRLYHILIQHQRFSQQQTRQ